ncbi:MAG: hypothetical protein HYZ96_01170 [Candidatus Omnitrophica bacterium]|nr:hypothetical protein [Candidatus Omnitrophota bacterium]
MMERKLIEAHPAKPGGMRSEDTSHSLHDRLLLAWGPPQRRGQQGQVPEIPAQDPCWRRSRFTIVTRWMGKDGAGPGPLIAGSWSSFVCFRGPESPDRRGREPASN